MHSSTTSKPSPKRTKLSDSSQRTTIASKIAGEEYNAVDELVSDLDQVTAEILEDLQEKVKSGDASSGAAETERLHMVELKKRLNNLIVGEMIQRPRALKMQSIDILEDESTRSKEITMASHDKGRTVLTLCGGERSAKQLFSSLAKPSTQNAALAEQPLPNGITTTNLVPVHSLGEGAEKPVTIGQRFPTSSRLKALSPPKPASKYVSTRSSSISWHNPAEALATPKETNARDTYIKQPLSTGRWLTYNVAPSPEQLTSPKSKQKHRDRALSTGEPQSAIPIEISAVRTQAKEDALFRSVYSSFAPSHDDFGAVITENQKNRLWWSKHGEAQYQELLDTRDDKLYGIDDYDWEKAIAHEEIDENIVEEAISNWESIRGPSETLPDHRANGHPQPTESEGLLQEISELLETLNSHQRVRNLANARGLPGQKEPLTSMPSSPSSPSFAEKEVYETLRSQLVDIITTLPPYMVAKLDGDKLGALQISTKIEIPGKDQKGTLEEDGLLAKPNISSATTYPTSYAGAPALRGAYSNTPNGQQFPSRQGYGPTPVQRQPPVASSYAAAQYSTRPASASQYPGGSTRPAYGGQYTQQRTASSYVDRYANGQYGHQQSQHSYSQYGSTYRSAVAQQTGSYGQTYSTPQPRIPPGSTAAAQAFRGTQSEYQQRAPVPPAYNYGSTQGGASASPNMSQGSSFSGPAGVPGQQRPQLYHQHSSHYGSRSPAEPHINGVGTNGQGRMSPVDQATLIDRQKTQLADQHARQGSDTPQPTTGQSTQQNGTPAPQPNGVTV